VNKGIPFSVQQMVAGVQSIKALGGGWDRRFLLPRAATKNVNDGRTRCAL
jgi:hypothetical protein